MEETVAADRSTSWRVRAPDGDWVCRRAGSHRTAMPPGTRPFSWISPMTLWRSRNHWLALVLGDPSLTERPEWVARQRRRGGLPPDLVMRRDGDAMSMVALGDPGEGDESQYAVLPALLAAAGDTDFMVVTSDVVYPGGDATDYESRLLRPYRDYAGPIYGVPGNHDWYDDLEGFMWHFCGAERPPDRLSGGRRGWRGMARRLLARRSRPLGEPARRRAEALRPHPGQPGPYWAMDAGPLRLIGIDVGIRGQLDAEQGAWLRRVAGSSDRPKVLLSGQPLYGDAQRTSIPIEGGGNVEEIVHDPANSFVAVVAGDLHNYQRYPVRTPDGRTVQHIACGGGGAFTHATHTIARVDLPEVQEADVRLHPLRGDSLSRYAALFEERRRRRSGAGAPDDDLRIAPDEASALVAERLGLEPVRPSAHGVVPSERARRAAKKVHPRAGLGRLYYSERLDWNDPPLLKSFVRLDATPGELRVRLFAVSGCGEHEATPAVEEDLRIPLQRAPVEEGRPRYRVPRREDGPPEGGP